MFNTSHNFDITIERTHVCKVANELNKQLPSRQDVPEPVYESLLLVLYIYNQIGKIPFFKTTWWTLK